jgi:tryptophan-rich sensory protein
MKFNFVIIPAIIALTAYVGTGFTKRGLRNWYSHLHKPKWTPTGQMIGQIWTILYLLTGFSMLWFWNVPAFGMWQYIVGAIMLVNAYLNAYWNKAFFVEHNFKKSIKWMQYLNATTIAAAVIMFITSHFAALLLVPYIIWVYIATKLTKEIQKLNK